MRYLLPPILRDAYIRPKGPRPRPPAWLLVPYDRLTDEQWAALQPYLPMPARGRPCDQRAHLDAIFRVAATEGAWRELPPGYGKAETVARHFRRLTHAGLWERLLRALAAAPPGSLLRQLEGLICRAARRAIRLRGLPLIALARRLDLLRALPGPPHLVADPDLSEIIPHLPVAQRIRQWRRDKGAALEFLRGLRALHTLAGGRSYIPRHLREAWL
jgi:transposase